jgi:hypothetical protein
VTTSVKGLPEEATVSKKSGKPKHGREMADSAAEIERPTQPGIGGLIITAPYSNCAPILEVADF